MNEDKKKIPYDATPITRDYNQAPKASPEKGRGKISAAIFIVAIFIFNIVVGISLISLLSRPSGDNSVNNVTYNIDTSSTEAVSVAAGKAKLSAVVVGCGGSNSNGSYSASNVPNYKELFNTSSKGAGVIIQINKNTNEAYILTCYHVVGNYTAQIFVCLYDSYVPMYATLVGLSQDNDLAVVKVTNSQIASTIATAVTVSDSAALIEGDTAIAIGNPNSKGFAVTSGVISRFNVPVVPYGTTTLITIQVDTAINGGNSGGGLFDSNGNFIGIVESKINSQNVDNVAYVVPSNRAISVAKCLIRTGGQLQYVDADYSVSVAGVKSLAEATDELGRYHRYYKCVVNTIETSSKEYQAGMRIGDEIISYSYDGNSVNFVSEYSYEEFKYNITIGTIMQYKLKHTNGVEETITFEVTKSPTLGK